MHLFECGIDVLQAVHFAAFDIADKVVDLTLRGNQTGDVHPFAAACRGFGFQAGTYLLVVLKVNAFQPLDDRVPEELMDSNLIELNTFHQSGITDLGTMERVDIRKFARSIAQILQCRHSFQHLLHGIGTEQIIINEIQFVGIRTSVALRPFLCIADSSHATQVDTRHEVSGIVLLDQIREGQVGSVGMVDVASHYKRESTYTGRPQDVRIGSGLGTTFQRALMDGT